MTGEHRRVGLLSDSVIADDPRLRRQGEMLTHAGFDVVAIGQGQARSERPDWPIRAIDPALAALDARDSRGLRGFSRKALRLCDIAILAGYPRHAERIYWRLNRRYNAMLALARREKVDFWIANDWSSLPIALALEAETGTAFGYDTHELAVDEYAHSLAWRIRHRPIVRHIETRGIGRARFVTCVSDGIANRLAEVYRLERRPTVVRNMPNYTSSPLRRTESPIRVLYHGIVAPGRGLEASIASVAQWRPGITLTLRGPGDATYLAQLARQIEGLGLGGRIVLAPPVPMTDLVAEARTFDIGLFVMPDSSLQNHHVLPNKFFEYVAAGLVLCVSDLPEMRELVDRFALGTCVRSGMPADIAAAINALSLEPLDDLKRNALAAARELCWEQESGKLLNLVREGLDGAAVGQIAVSGELH